MALIVEDATGLSNAESYASVAEADTYLTSIGANIGAWLAASTTEKEYSLRNATAYIDNKFSSRFQGQRKEARTQRLAWPRYGVEVDSVPLDYTPLPRLLKEATIEAARRDKDQRTLSLLLVPDTTDGTISSESVTVGAISESKSYQGGKPALARFNFVEWLLTPLLIPQSFERS